MKILLTGGSGYIGSHACIELLNAGYHVVVLDNLSGSSEISLSRVSKVTGRELTFIRGDIRDSKLLACIFDNQKVRAVLHFAGLKAVGESVDSPLEYYENNVAGTICLCRAMAHAKVYNLVFSSSATVYGDPVTIPIPEDAPTGRATNPYGRSKDIVEKILIDLAKSDSRWRIAILRYFNPVGAHPSGLIGENPSGVPNNLTPYIARVAAGRLPKLSIFGNDYPTFDGTGIRDYIHVVDLAEGHLSALQFLDEHCGSQVWNLGTGRGYSVLEMVRAFEAESGVKIPYEIAPRRPGDIAICYADSSKAERELGWVARRGLDQMVADAWRWQSMNPNGYGS